MEAMQSHFAQLRKLQPIPVGTITFGSALGDPGIAAPREGGRKTTYSGAAQDGDSRSRHYRRDPIGPRVSLFQPRAFQPGASSPLRQEYLLAPPPVEARQQNPLRSHPIGRENPSLLRAKRGAPPARQEPERLRLRRMKRRLR
jgi:hypothetical protein